MTVTDLHDAAKVSAAGTAAPHHAGPTNEQDALLAKLEHVITLARQPAVLTEVRQALNESGIANARKGVTSALDILDKAQREQRTADAALRDAKDALDNVTAEIEWELEEWFANRSNKQWLVRDRDGKPIEEAAQKSYAEADRKQFKALVANQRPELLHAKKAVYAAAEEVARCNHEVNLAEKRLRAAEGDRKAAITVAETLRLGITPGGTR